MSFEKFVAIIDEACDWVLSKKGCTVSTQVKWVDWEKKIYSPLFCCLWYSQAKDQKSWVIPPEREWIEILSTFFLKHIPLEEMPALSSLMLNKVDVYQGLVNLVNLCYHSNNWSRLHCSVKISEILDDSLEILVTQKNDSFCHNDRELNKIAEYLRAKYPVKFQPKRNWSGTSSANKKFIAQKISELLIEYYQIEQGETSKVSQG